MNKRTIMGVIMMSILMTACSTQEKEKKTENAVSVKTETVQSYNDISVREYVGVVEEESATSVSFAGSGTLTRVCVSAGQRVKKGQLVAEIDKTQAHNMLTAAQAMMNQANDAEARMRQLHDNNSLPDMDWVETQSKVQQAKAQLDIARKALSDCSVYAPVSGVVGRDVASVGETALPAMPIAKILDISRVKVKTSIPEKEIATISPNTETMITVDALGGKQFCGGMIEKVVEPSSITHTYDIKVCLNNPNCELLPGMVCKVKTNVSENQNDEQDNQLSVPITSVHQNAKGQNFVWVIKDMKATRRVVTLGDAAGNRVVILSGLKTGDVIVTEGHQKLSEGIKVVRN